MKPNISIQFFEKFILFTLILLVFLVRPINAQVGGCGTSPASIPEIALDNSVGCYPDILGPFFIRIYPHVIRTSNGTGGQTDIAIKEAIEIMRADFAPHNIFFVWEDCQIDVIANNVLFSTTVPDLDNLYGSYGSFDGINLFFFPDEQGLFYNGEATLPGKALYLGGITVEWDNEIFTAMESRVLSHEMGHCLGLYHTHQTNPDRFPNNNIPCCDNYSGEKVDGSNGCDCGDYVQDTPANPGSTSNNVTNPGCHFTSTLLDCESELFNPDEKNIMGYTYSPCRQYFSPGQGERMRWVISQGGLNPEAWELTGVLANNAFNNLVVSNSTVWDLNNFPGGLVSINQSLTIESGATLSISSDITVEFASDAFLNIKPNAALELNGTLTSLCGGYWQGVFVSGDCSKSQSPNNGVYAQGRFLGGSNGIVENAVSAVRNFGLNGSGGGHIICRGTTFRNNRFGIVFSEYFNRNPILTSTACVPPGLFLNDVSIVDRCKFITDDNYPPTLSPFQAFMQLYRVRGVKILGPDCSNTKTSVDCSGSLSSTCYGYGIQSINAGFRLHNSLSAPNGTSKFKGLSFGIHVTLSTASRPTSISGATFIDCYKGIYATKSVGIDISSCNFYLGKVPDPNISDRQFGTILFQNPMYKYGLNKTYGPPVNVEKTIGTCVSDCGELNNIVFKNRYDNVMIGNVANFLNAGGPEPRGLLYECNTNVGIYGFDFTQPVAGDLVRRVQGILPANQNDPTLSSGNKFSYNQFIAESDFSYRGGGILQYYYLPDNPQIVGDENQQPFDFFGLVTIPSFTNPSCNSPLGGDFLPLIGIPLQNEKNQYYQNQTAYLQAKYNYNTALQSGNAPLAAQHLERAGFFRAEMDKSATTVLRSIIFDTINPQLDSIRRWTLNLETLASSFMTILDDLDFGEVVTAQSTYNAIPSQLTLSVEQILDYNQFGSILSILSVQSMDALDSVAIQTFLTITQQPKGFSAQTAKSILGLNGFSFDSPECTLPSCCEFERAGTERGANQPLLTSELSLQVFPNPAQQSVNFVLDTSFPSPVHIKVWDISGNLVWTQEFLSKTTWNVADVPAGLYFYTLSGGAENPISGKIAITH